MSGKLFFISMVRHDIISILVTEGWTNGILRNRKLWDIQKIQKSFLLFNIEGYAKTFTRSQFAVLLILVCSVRDPAHRIFSFVDKEARKALKIWLKELAEGPDRPSSAPGASMCSGAATILCISVLQIIWRKGLKSISWDLAANL